MLAFAFLLLIGFHGAASPPWRIYVNPGESRDTFHIAYPPAWNLERHDGSIVVASPNGEVGLTISLHAGKGETPDACAAAHLQDQGGAFTSTPTRQSLITMNWRAVSLEARGRQPGEEEDTVRYSACLESSPTPGHPLVSITSTASASVFDRHRDVIVQISESVRFRPAA
ncbi:MAG: hypothetical protein ACXWWJ_08835 [Nitrospira sp.]